MYELSKNKLHMLWSKIEDEIQRQDLTYAETAKRAGIARSTLSEFKRGNIKKPSFELMCKLADGLDVDINYFKEV